MKRLNLASELGAILLLKIAALFAIWFFCFAPNKPNPQENSITQHLLSSDITNRLSKPIIYHRDFIQNKVKP